MIKKFFGGEIIRSPHSADMYFDRKAIYNILGINEDDLRRLLDRLKYESVKGLIFDGDRAKRTLWHKYGIDTLLALTLASTSKNVRQKERFAQLIDFCTKHINNLCYDEFTSLRGWCLPPATRRAIMAHVCDVPNYLDIPLSRIEVNATYYGSLLRNIAVTAENLAIPEAWITRSESTSIRAIDLSIFLMVKYLVTDKTPDELLLDFGIDVSRGIYEDAEKLSMVEKIREIMV